MSRRVEASSTGLLISLLVLEGSALLGALALYNRGARPWSDFVASPTGLCLVVAVLAFAASGLLLPHLLRNAGTPITALLALNVASVLLAASGAEAMIRLLAAETPAGTLFAGTLLLPRSWDAIAARNRAILERAASRGSYLVADDRLGWTIGRDRRSGDYNREFVERYLSRRAPSHARPSAGESAPGPREPGGDIYLSSAEGLRSPRAGIAFADVPARERIALVGDSFTFGLEVRYEETWGHQLEVLLGAGTQVLNFGVDGYGVDQATLRYRRDAVGWNPGLVILGVIDDDLRRTMCVYAFLCFPGSDLPFAKPRFVLRQRSLELVNVPLPAPDALFAEPAISDLPFVALDPAYRDAADWKERFFHRLYSVRFLVSRFPRWSPPAPGSDDAAMRALNAAILRSFLREVGENGSRALVVYFPSELPDPSRDAEATPSVAKQVLATAGVPFVDTTDCVDSVPPDRRFVALHYSAATNAAIARCLADSIHAGTRAPAGA